MTPAGAALRLSFADERTRKLFSEISADAVIAPSAAGVRMRARGPDPFVRSGPISVDMSATNVLVLTADLLGQGGHALKIYFASNEAPAWVEEQSLRIAAPAGAGRTVLAFDFSRNPLWKGTSLALRVDLEGMTRRDAEVELVAIELLARPTDVRDLVMPARPPVAGERFHVQVGLAGEGLALQTPTLQTPLAILASPHPARFRAEAGSLARAAFELQASDPGLASITLAPLGASGSLTADVWIRNASAPRQEASAGLSLVGELVAITRDGLAAWIVPEIGILVGSGGKLRRVSLVCNRSVAVKDGCIVMEGARRIDGIEIRASLAVGPERGSTTPYDIAIQTGAPLPVLDVALPAILFGAAPFPRNLALLPGVEMLDAGQLPDRRNMLPDASKVTWPMAYLELDSGTMAATFLGEAMAILTSPDTRGGTAENVLALHAPVRPEGRALLEAPAPLPVPYRLSGEIVLAPGASRASVLAAIGSHIVPVGPASDAPDLLRRAATALATTFRGPSGTTLPRIGALPADGYFDARSCLSLLAASRLGIADLESAARAELALLSKQRALVPLAVGLLFPEHLELALASLRRHAGEIAARQRPDGTFVPVLPPACVLPDPEALARTASAVAEPAALLARAGMLGLVDGALASRSLARLAGKLPTGGQSWEFAPSVPEVLGAAHAADAFLAAHEAGVDPEGIARAADWLALGTTFFRRMADDTLACFPALGVTRGTDEGILWFAHAPGDQLDWRGVSCPWVGLRFAGALERALAHAARHGGLAGDVRELFARVSRGALAHAATLLRDDGSLPDGFDTKTGVDTEPLYRAPLDVAWHALALMGKCPEATVARNGPLVAAGVGAFRIDGPALVFIPAVPGPQALIRVERGGPRASTIDGDREVVVEPV